MCYETRTSSRATDRPVAFAGDIELRLSPSRGAASKLYVENGSRTGTPVRIKSLRLRVTSVNHGPTSLSPLERLHLLNLRQEVPEQVLDSVS